GYERVPLKLPPPQWLCEPLLPCAAFVVRRPAFSLPRCAGLLQSLAHSSRHPPAFAPPAWRAALHLVLLRHFHADLSECACPRRAARARAFEKPEAPACAAQPRALKVDALRKKLRRRLEGSACASFPQARISNGHD